MSKVPETLETVVIRFAGDSGDGMQLTGSQFTETSAFAGNDLATFPDYPSEIRAPAGTIAGVSGFQLSFSSKEVFTHGDTPDVLVAMNPAALTVNIKDLRTDGILIVNTEAFTAKNLKLAGYESNPIEDGSLSAYRVHAVDITGMTLKAIADVGLSKKAAVRSKNFFALGLVYWMFNRDIQHTCLWIEGKFGKKAPKVAEANGKAMKAGHYYGETAEIFTHSYVVAEAEIKPGHYRNIKGNEATALGLAAAAELSGLDLFLGSYPITPATDILQYLAGMKHLGIKTVQCEDEIAGVCSSIGAAYTGALAVTTTSGPGLALKGEALGLAMILEVPLVIINVQRGGPSTGMPTKTEQSDLMQAMYGRNGEAPMVVIAAQSPGDCFYTAIEASRIALRHMVPVVMLSDGYLANGSEPWLIPEMDKLEKINVKFHTDPETFEPYGRDENLSRPWAIPGTPGLEHRVGGLEKQHKTGNVCMVPENHQLMVELRQAKVEKVADFYGPTEVFGDDSGVLVLGWGGTYGALRAGVTSAREEGAKAAHVHLRYVNPMPKDLGEILARYDRIVIPELNNGQLDLLVRAKYGVKTVRFNKLTGRPFKESEIVEVIVAEEVQA